MNAKSFPLLLLLALALVARAEDFLPGVHRIVFLGDSITHAGQYVEDFEAYAVRHEPERALEILDLGLSSETVSGLSEEGHAGGKFPRPDLHERLARVLAKTKPDLVFACYGMNDGIYLHLDEERFARFRAGIEKLHAAVETAGGKIIHLTPPVYDALPNQGHLSPEAAGYDAVLTKYSEWLLEQRARGWKVIDVHSAMTRALAEKRKSDPGFFFAKDGVHPNAEGQHVISAALLEGLGCDPAIPTTPQYAALQKLVHSRERVLSDAWLTECGHLRPGVAKGLPVAEAQARADELRPQIVAAAKAL